MHRTQKLRKCFNLKNVFSGSTDYRKIHKVIGVMKYLIMIPILSCCLSLSTFGAVSVSPAGVQMVWDDGGEHFGNFKTFNTKKGIKLALFLKNDKASFVKLDQNKSAVKVCGEKGRCSFFGSSSISEDGKMLKLEVGADGAKPVDGKIVVKGELVVISATGKGEVSTEMVEWKKGGSVQFPKDSGLPTFKIETMGKPKWGDEKWEVTLKCSEDYEQFVSVKFIDEKGVEHKAKRGSWSSMGFFGKKTVTVSYKAPEVLTKAKMVVEYWKGTQEEKVPVNLVLGLDGEKK